MPAFFFGSRSLRGARATKQSRITEDSGLLRFARNDGIAGKSGARSAADIDHVAVAGRGVLVDEAGDQDASVERDDLAVLLAAGRAGRADIVLADLAALEAQ